MSKIGNLLITISPLVSISIEGQHIKIVGPKGNLEYQVHPAILLNYDEANRNLSLSRTSEEKKIKAMHGLTRALLSNAIIGVEKPWIKRLSVVGTGYRVKSEGSGISLEVGYSHHVKFAPPEGISIATEGNNTIIVSGIDKQKVGEVAKNIKAVRPPDAYKGKGLRYEGEYIKVKPGKKSKA